MQTIFDELLQFKAPASLAAAVSIAARREHQSVSEFLRRCAITRVREMGVPLDGSHTPKPTEEAV